MFSETLTAFETSIKPLRATMASSSIVLRHRPAYWASAGFFAGSLDLEESSFLLRKGGYIVGASRPAVGNVLVGSVVEWWKDVMARLRPRCCLVVGC